MSKKEIFIVCILVFIAIVRFLFFLPTRPSYDEALGKNVSFEGVVTDAPDVRSYSQRIIVRPINQKNNILVIISNDQELNYGDKIIVSGILETPENFITSVGKEFNYQRYLANRNIYFILNASSLEIISHKNLNPIIYYLFKLRKYFMGNINELISHPKSDLANGLILGYRGGFDNSLKDEFIKTGTIHIVALSGYNITIVAESVIRTFSLFLNSLFSTIFGIIIIILFILMTGASSTAIRAGIMASIILFARVTGRNYQAGRALVIAFLLMLVYDIRVITDISFQLSFLATFGVLFITPKVIPWFRFLPNKFNLRSLVATTISATISVLPILLYSTGIFSLVSLPANILILPFIPTAMFFSFISALLKFVSVTLAIPFSFISDLILSYILSVIHSFANFKFASFGVKSFPLILVVIIYILILWWVFGKNKIKK